MTLLHYDDRTELLAEHGERYQLGPLVLTGSDEHGCAWLSELSGWDAPSVTTPLDRRPDGHGGYLGSSSYDPRSLSIEGTVTAPSRTELRRARDRLLGALFADLTGYVRFVHLDDEPAPRGLWVRPTGEPRWNAFSDRAADYAFVVVADDPIRTGDTATYGPVRLAGTAVEGGYAMTDGGLPMPAASTGATSSATVVRVENPGDEAAHAVYRVAGPVPQPVIQLGTGEFVHLRLDLGELDTVTVDTAAGVVEMNGVIRYDAWGPGSTFPLIPGVTRDRTTGEVRPGGTEVRLRSFTNGADPRASLLVDSAPSWR